MLKKGLSEVGIMRNKLVRNTLFFFERMNVNGRKYMFEHINAFLTAMKLAAPHNYHSHYIQYKVYDDTALLLSKEKYVLKDYRTEKKKYAIELKMIYFDSGIKIYLTDVKDKKKLTTLSIEIRDYKVKDVLSDEFKALVAKYFGKPVYTSLEFDSAHIDYEQTVSGPHKRITDAFIKLNLAVEKLGRNSI